MYTGINQIVSDRVTAMMQDISDKHKSLNHLICLKQKEFSKCLSEEQQKYLGDIDNLCVEAETNVLIEAYQTGLQDGLKLLIEINGTGKLAEMILDSFKQTNESNKDTAVSMA